MAGKIPTWEETDSIPSWDETAPTAARPKEQRPPQPLTHDVQAFGSDQAGKLASQYFPRAAKAASQGKGYGPQVGASILDLLSLPGRAIRSSGVAPKGATWRDGNPELARTDGFMADPGMGAALLTAPFTMGASIPAIMGAGAVAGTASAAAHQGDKMLEGGEFSPGQTAGEIALNTLLPVVARGAGHGLQWSGKKIMNTIMKVKEGIQEQIAKTGEETIADLIFKHNLDSPIPFRGGVEGIQTRNNALRQKANDAFGNILDEADRVVTLTSKAPQQAAAGAARTGVNASGRVVTEPDVIYAGQMENPAIEGGRQILIPESTVPGAPDVVRAGMNRSPLLTDGKPGIVITPAPRPGAMPPEVAITPNPVQMPNRIDPRYAKPGATPTSNQPPIANAPEGAAYGIPSDRNLPTVRAGAPVPVAGRQAIPIENGDPFTEEELKLLGRAPGVPAEAPAGFSGSGPPLDQGTLRLPPGIPGASESAIDLTKKIDLGKAIRDAFSKLGAEFQEGGMHAGVLPGIDQGEEYWSGALARKTGEDLVPAPIRLSEGFERPVPVRFSQGFKQEAGDAGNFLATDPGDVKGKARFANALYREIRDQQNGLLPDLIPINKLLSETHPIKAGLEDAIPRLEKNNIISPTDLWSLAPAAVGGGAGMAAHSPMAATLAFSAPLTLNRLSKNPTVASQMYRLGESMVDPLVLANARKKAIERALSYNLFGAGP